MCECLCVCVCRAEGRGWYSTHRGRLWIAATSQVPDSKDILRIQQFYMDRAEGEVLSVRISVIILD